MTGEYWEYFSLPGRIFSVPVLVLRVAAWPESHMVLGTDFLRSAGALYDYGQQFCILGDIRILLFAPQQTMTMDVATTFTIDPVDPPATTLTPAPAVQPRIVIKSWNVNSLKNMFPKLALDGYTPAEFFEDTIKMRQGLEAHFVGDFADAEIRVQ